MIKGINYDTGFVHDGVSTHEPFDPDAVAADMRVIHDDLGAAAVRITGGVTDRIETAARAAADVGLAVWWCPVVCDIATDALVRVVGDAAERAERIRWRGTEVVLSVGAELGLFLPGFLPGEQFLDRVAVLGAPDDRLAQALDELPGRLNDYLATLVDAARSRFSGSITYCSLPFEGVDWRRFDVVATDAGYRSSEDEETFRSGLRELRVGRKPLAITEFGCSGYVGAAALGAHGVDAVVWDGPRPVRLDGDHPRDEAEQARYVHSLFAIFDSEGVDAAFVHTFASRHLPRRADPATDLDRASMGVVAVLEDGYGTAYPTMRWEPKEAFHAVAAFTPRS